MRTLAVVAALAVLTSLPGTAGAQFEGVLDYRMTTPAEDAKLVPLSWRMWIGKSGWRSEMSMDRQAVAPDASKERAAPMTGVWKMVSLGRIAEPGVSYVLNDEKKAYAVLRAEGSPPTGAAEKWTVEAKGKDTVAGLACDRALIRNAADGSEIDGCFARDITISREWLTAMRRGAGEEDQWMDALWQSGVKGFPVRMTFRTRERTGPSTVELVKVTRQAVPESMLRVPQGYKEVGLMGVMTSPEQDQMISDQMKQMREQLDQLPPEQRKQIEEMMKQFGQQPRKP